MGTYHIRSINPNKQHIFSAVGIPIQCIKLLELALYAVHINWMKFCKRLIPKASVIGGKRQKRRKKLEAKQNTAGASACAVGRSAHPCWVGFRMQESIWRHLSESWGC